MGKEKNYKYYLDDAIAAQEDTASTKDYADNMFELMTAIQAVCGAASGACDGTSAGAYKDVTDANILVIAVDTAVTAAIGDQTKNAAAKAACDAAKTKMDTAKSSIVAVQSAIKATPVDAALLLTQEKAAHDGFIEQIEIAVTQVTSLTVALGTLGTVITMQLSSTWAASSAVPIATKIIVKTSADLSTATASAGTLAVAYRTLGDASQTAFTEAEKASDAAIEALNLDVGKRLVKAFEDAHQELKYTTAPGHPYDDAQFVTQLDSLDFAQFGQNYTYREDKIAEAIGTVAHLYLTDTDFKNNNAAGIDFTDAQADAYVDATVNKLDLEEVI